MMEKSNGNLCAPLQQLIGEHVTLRADMNLFYDVTEEIEFESGPELTRLFASLYEQIAAFIVKLEAHSKREEEGLFPMMNRRLGEDDKTIEAMEYEHEKAEQHLKDFIKEAAQAGTTIEEEEAQSITVYAVQAYATLSQHFAKEENMLFPLAERLLSDEEKQELDQFLRA